jgi:hypothetical protein
VTDEETEPRQAVEMMRALLDAQQLKLGVHIRKMNSPGSPVYRTWENVWPASLVLVSSFAGTALVHLYVGGIVLLAGLSWWLAKVQPRVKDGVFDRTMLWSLQSDAHFDGLWAKGVLSLYAELPDGRKLAATRRDDWRGFVRLVARANNATPTEDAA